MKCLYCGEEFTPLSVNQLYCSRSCGNKYRRRNEPPGYPSIQFNCSQCGRTVVTDGVKDQRTRFCSAQCEKRFWRHPPHESESNRINFRSIDDYARYERRTNEE